MRSLRTARRLMAGAALSLVFAAGGAQAAHHVLNLSGSAFDTVTNAFTAGGIDYQTGTLALSGFTPFMLEDGDTVEVNVDITSGPLFPFIVPTAQQMFFGLNFSDILGGAQPEASTSSGTFSFDGGSALGAGCSNCTSLIYGQNNTPLSFTHLFATGAFTLPAPYQINSISVSYQVNGDAAVPEPGAWALMILGFGGAGAMLRRRRAVFSAA